MSEEKEIQEVDEKSDTKRRVLGAIILILVVVGLFSIIYFAKGYYNKNNQPSQNQEGISELAKQIQKYNIQYTEDELLRKARFECANIGYSLTTTDLPPKILYANDNEINLLIYCLYPINQTSKVEMFSVYIERKK